MSLWNSLVLDSSLEFLHQGTADFWNSFYYSSKTQSVSWTTVIKIEVAIFFSSSINTWRTVLTPGIETVIYSDILQSTRIWYMLGLVHVTGYSPTLLKALQDPPCRQYFHFWESWLHWETIYCKAKLETWLEHRQHRLAEQPAVKNNDLKAGTAMGATTESQPRSWLLQGCITSNNTGVTWWDCQGVDPGRCWHRNLLAANPAHPLLLPRQRRHLAAMAGAGRGDPSGCFVPWEETETLTPHRFPCVSEKQGNEISLNLQVVSHEDERKEKRAHAFLFCHFQARADQPRQDSCFTTELTLKKIPAFAWTETIWVLSSTQRAAGFACHKLNSSWRPYCHVWPQRHHYWCELVQLTRHWSSGLSRSLSHSISLLLKDNTIKKGIWQRGKWLTSKEAPGKTLQLVSVYHFLIYGHFSAASFKNSSREKYTL